MGHGWRFLFFSRVLRHSHRHRWNKWGFLVFSLQQSHSIQYSHFSSLAKHKHLYGVRSNEFIVQEITRESRGYGLDHEVAKNLSERSKEKSLPYRCQVNKDVFMNLIAEDFASSIHPPVFMADCPFSATAENQQGIKKVQKPCGSVW